MTNKLDRNLKYFILYGVITELAINLYKPFAVKFLERLGGTDFDISLFNALPGFIMLFSLIPGILLLRNLDVKKTTAVTTIFSRFFILLYVFIPLLPPVYQPIVFVVITALMSAPSAVYTSAIQSLTGDLFQPEQRANALGLKSKYGVLVVLVVTLLTGQMLTTLPKSDSERILLYQIFFIIAVLLVVFELVFLNKMTLKSTSPNTMTPLRELFKEMLHNKKFIVFVACSATFHFGWQMGWPIFSIYTIKNLGADERWLAITSLSSLVTMFIGHHYWPRFITKYGNATITAICTLGMSATPILYIFSKDLYALTITNIFTGFVTSGTLLVLLGGSLEVIPRENRMMYMGAYTTVTNLTLAISPFVSHFFLANYGIQTALVITCICRVIGGFTFVIRDLRMKKGTLLA